MLSGTRLNFFRPHSCYQSAGAHRYGNDLLFVAPTFGLCREAGYRWRRLFHFLAGSKVPPQVRLLSRVPWWRVSTGRISSTLRRNHADQHTSLDAGTTARRRWHSTKVTRQATGSASPYSRANRSNVHGLSSRGNVFACGAVQRDRRYARRRHTFAIFCRERHQRREHATVSSRSRRRVRFAIMNTEASRRRIRSTRIKLRGQPRQMAGASPQPATFCSAPSCGAGSPTAEDTRARSAGGAWHEAIEDRIQPAAGLAGTRPARRERQVGLGAAVQASHGSAAAPD